MKNYVNEISKVMFNYDIEGLKFDEMYQQDEYDREAELVLKHINADMTVKEVADVCRVVYDEMFIPDHDIEEFIEIASEILKILN